MKPLDEIRATCTNPGWTGGHQSDYTAALETEYERMREKLSKGAWTSEIPTEEGMYFVRSADDSAKKLHLIKVYCLSGIGFCGVPINPPGSAYALYAYSRMYFNNAPIEFARVLTPEDLE